MLSRCANLKGLLVRIIENCPSAENTLAYADKVKEHSERHQLKRRLQETLTTVDDFSIKPHELWQELAEQQEKIITTKRSNGFMFEPIKTLNWIIEDFLEFCSLTEVFGVPESGKSLLIAVNRR
jgi:phenylalanine-4-hydroxylase